jgi:hypothetical protein
MMHHRQMHVAALTVLGVCAALPQSAQAQQGMQSAPGVEAQIAAQIVDREPQEAGTVFAADVGQVYCWSRFTGAEGTTIQHVWIHDGVEYPVSLAIGGSPWRTWSSKSIPPEWAGDWRVEIRDSSGNMMETLSFTVGG